MFDGGPEPPRPRTPQQRREYIVALEQERDECRATGREDKAKLCDVEIAAAQAEATRTETT
jgi:hypothetical protein